MFDTLAIGSIGETQLVVAQEHTAAHLGSGLLPVLATPQMIALMEGAAVEAVARAIPEGYQTVGIALDVRHLAATPIGGQVTARAELIEIDRAKLTYRVEAFDAAGKIGEGQHQRFVVEVARFMRGADKRAAAEGDGS